MKTCVVFTLKVSKLLLNRKSVRTFASMLKDSNKIYTLLATAFILIFPQYSFSDEEYELFL